MNLWIFAVAALLVLMLGCTGTAGQQQPPAQNPPAIGARTGASVENTTAQAPPQKQYTCAITLNPSTINAGSSTEVGFAVQSEQSVEFTYNCGSEIRSISTGGLTSGSRLCQFGTPGNVDIWIKADGVVCAQKTLVVRQPQVAKACYIDPSSVKRDLAGYVYDARVQFTGFSPQDVLIWTCDHTTVRHTLGGDGALGMPLYSDIYCDFAGRPINDSIAVSIGDVSCGSISTR